MNYFYTSTISFFHKRILIKYKSFEKYIRMTDECDWKGVPVSHIQGSNSPWGAPEFPLIQPAYNHSVLYHIPSNGAVLDRPPKPQIGKDKWDDDHVRLPCSPHSLYPVENSTGGKSIVGRWEMIQKALSRSIRNSHELAEAILSYNTQYKSRWKFQSLHVLFNEYLEEEESKYFFDVTLPEIAKLALNLPKLIQSPIPLLKQNTNKSLSLSQQQISCLLANAFFCTFPRRNTMKKNSEYATYPHINFNSLYNCSPADNVMEKLKCICHYFRRVCTKVPVGVMTLRRRSARSQPRWSTARQPLAALPLHVRAGGAIEDADGLLQIDFANKFLGGGVLNYGCVQEEIRFMICPELLISLLVTEVLKPNEALIMIGCERYSQYSGYASSFQWAGARDDRTPRDSSGRRRCAVLALDARPYASRPQQYSPEAIRRELGKAWVGFSVYAEEDPGEEVSEVTLQYPGVATGNWGCGAFGGTAELKWLIQAMAAVRAGRPLAYFTFGDVPLRDSIAEVYTALASQHVTVGELYEYLMRYCKTDVTKTSLNTFLEKVLNERKSQTYTEPRDYTVVDTKEDTSIFLNHLNESPDMFTEDEDTPKTLISKTDGCNKIDQNDQIDLTIDSSSLEIDNAVSSNKMAPSTTKMASSTDKMASTDKMSLSTDKMSLSADEMVSSPEKMSLFSEKMSLSTDKMAESDKTSNTSKLFDEMGKLDEESGKLNLNSRQKLFFSDRVRERTDGAEDKVHFEVTSEVKKKITKKITDYFSKKPT